VNVYLHFAFTGTRFAEANIHAVKVTASYTPLIRVGVAIGFAATVLIGN